MYNILISIGAALVDFLLLYYFGLPWWGAIIVSLFVFAGTFVLISRMVMKKVMAVMETVAKDLQGQRLEKAVRELGWKPKYPKLDDIVATAWAWHKQNPNGYPD